MTSHRISPRFTRHLAVTRRRPARLIQRSVVKQNVDAAIAGLRRRVQDTGRTFRGATPSAKVLMAIFAALLLAPVFDHAVSFFVPLRPIWGGTEGYCDRHKLGCDLTTHVLADGALAVLAYFTLWQKSLRTKTIWRRR